MIFSDFFDHLVVGWGGGGSEVDADGGVGAHASTSRKTGR